MLPGPQARVFGQALRRPIFRIPGIIQEKLDRIFHGLDVTYVDDPNLHGAVAISQVHLLPHPWHQVGVEPLVVSRPADIIIVIVNPIGTGARLIIDLWQLADVSPVVVAQQQGHVIRHAHAFVIVILHFFVQSPELRNFCRIFAGDLLQNLPLVRHDLFQQGNGRALGHRLIAVAAHADGGDAFVGTHSADAVPPEFLQGIFIGHVIPGAGAVTPPLIVRPHQRLVVRRADHHAIFIGQRGVERIIVIERPAPHGRPEIIALHP